MLKHADGDGRYRVMGIDPGGDTIGTCVVGYDAKENVCYLEHAETLTSSRRLKDYRHLEDVHGSRFVRQVIIQHFIQELVCQYTPHHVVSEAPFLGRFPQAFASLTECLQLLRLIVYNYDSEMTLETVDPPSVKNAVGVKGKTKDKQLVADAVATLPLVNLTGQSILTYDEHTTDAIAVAWWRLNPLLKRGLPT